MNENETFAMDNKKEILLLAGLSILDKLFTIASITLCAMILHWRERFSMLFFFFTLFTALYMKGR